MKPVISFLKSHMCRCPGGIAKLNISYRTNHANHGPLWATRMRDAGIAGRLNR